MPVVFVDDKLHENEKILGASGDVVKLWLVSLSWCNDRLTDGYIPKLIAQRLIPLTARRADLVLKEIVAAPLWHLSGHPCKSCLELRKEKGVTAPVATGGYLIHHYFHYQLAAHKVKQGREQRSSAGLEGARARWGKGRGDGEPHGESHGGSHSEPHGGTYGGGYGESHGETDAVTHAVAMPRTPYPVPRTPGAIAPVPRGHAPEPEIPDAEPAGTARSGSQVRRGELRQVGTAATRIVTTARGAR